MRQTWNVRFLLGRAARWVLAVAVVPAGVVLGLFLAAIWLLWLATSWLYSLAMWLTIPAPAPGRGAPTTRVYGPGVVRRGPGDLRMIELSPPPPAAPQSSLVVRPRRHTVEDVRRSLAGMARYGWQKDKVIQALEAGGAAWMWSQRVDPARAPGQGGIACLGDARERVHLRYRPGDTLLQRYALPAARIDVWFDQAGRLLQGSAYQDQRL